jgi:hypothetical protein
MATLIAILFVIFYLCYLGFVLNAISQGKFWYVLVYLISFLPIYTVFISFTYAFLEIVPLTQFIKYSKELVFIYALAVWLIGRKASLINWSFCLTTLDKVFIAFLTMCFVFMVLPIGEASFVNKANYFKNLLLLGIAYFLGRQIPFSPQEWHSTFKLVLQVTVAAFFLVILEKVTATHFHSQIGFVKYGSDILQIEPEGLFDLRYTFQAQGGQPRYGSFFANPLEFAASMLISFSIVIVYLVSSKSRANKINYLILLGVVILCVLLAYSRATFVSFFIMLVYMAFLLRVYKLIVAFGIIAALMGVYIVFIAPDDLRYFVQDTILFQNASSVAHVLEWLEAWESMLANPMGIGLATSGNAGGVDSDLQVGGENQYLIFGVQLGFLGLILYLAMLFYSIRNGWVTFRGSSSLFEKRVAFIASSVKFGLLLPLFTSNVEIYLFVALFSWWLVGSSETLYQNYSNVTKEKLSNSYRLSETQV